jgi:hypothetical protein
MEKRLPLRMGKGASIELDKGKIKYYFSNFTNKES